MGFPAGNRAFLPPCLNRSRSACHWAAASFAAEAEDAVEASRLRKALRSFSTAAAMISPDLARKEWMAMA
eukprot:6061954-Pyramimonas_sp.AAC.1